MLFEKQLSTIAVTEDTLLSEVLRILERRTVKFLCVISGQGRLVGVLSYGDIVRSLSNLSYDPAQPVRKIMNRKFSSAPSTADQASVRLLLSRHRFVPIVDEMKKLTALAYGNVSARQFILGEHRIDSSIEFILIAEIGNNHNGSLDLAKDLIRRAQESGADIAKFQMRELSTLYGRRSASHDLSTEYLVNLLQKVSLREEDLFRCFDYCHELGITPLCTPFDINSLERLEAYGVEGYKIASADLTNNPLYQAIIDTGKPIIASTGMSTDEDIDCAIDMLEESKCNFAILHANSTYPTPYSDVHLNYLNNLKKRTNSVVGYSGHERGWHIALAAFSLGAQVIEKHFTIDKTMEGNDHKASLLPHEFKQLRTHLDDLACAMGDGHRRVLSQGESNNKTALAKSIFCVQPIEIGERISSQHLEIRSPGNGISPRYITDLVGRVAVRSISPGNPLYMEDLKGEAITYNNCFPRHFKWCIPVRHRDVYSLFDAFSPPSVEFHLSFRDLVLADEDILVEPLDAEVIVHAPEQFDEDFVLDLFSDNEATAKKSVNLLNHIFQKATNIGRLVNNSNNVKVIVNCGGHSLDGFMKEEQIASGIDRFVDRFRLLNLRGCRFLAQTMPPYPWHFGGQSFHNQFTSAVNIMNLLDASPPELEVCLDVSHSFMWCSHAGEEFREFFNAIMPNVSHIHISDASGTTSEGLQIGLGDVNFTELREALRGYEERATLMPEIWQGHENEGAGFRVALARLREFGF